MGELMDNENKRHHDELRTLHEDIGRIRDELSRGKTAPVIQVQPSQEPHLVSEEIHISPPDPARPATSERLGGNRSVAPASDIGDAVMEISERSDNDSLPGADANGTFWAHAVFREDKPDPGILQLYLRSADTNLIRTVP
jgi:hypothetical protein